MRIGKSVKRRLAENDNLRSKVVELETKLNIFNPGNSYPPGAEPNTSATAQGEMLHNSVCEADHRKETYPKNDFDQSWAVSPNTDLLSLQGEKTGECWPRDLELDKFSPHHIEYGSLPSNVSSLEAMFGSKDREDTSSLEVVSRLTPNEPTATVQQRNPPQSRTAIMYAAERGNVRMLEMLIANGADPSERDSCGMTALHIACQSGQLDAAAKLISCNASQNLDERNADGLTPFHLAVQQDHTDLACLLVQSGANIHLTFC